MQSLRGKLAHLTSKAGEPGMQRFLLHSASLLSCLEKAREDKNKALALYQTNARQCLFYLQALCRAYKKTGTKKRFKDIGGAVKILEDQLGKIDYWDGWLKECSACKGFPIAMLRTLRDHRERELLVFQRMLDDGRWFADDDSTLDHILDSLAELSVASRLRTIGRIGKKTAIEHHARILDAIERHDSNAAREAMREHIQAAGEDMDLASLKSRKSK